jgi:hypothetical protein
MAKSDEYAVGNSLSGVTTEHAAGAIVIGALVLLILVRRGFRGVSAGGVGISVK